MFDPGRIPQVQLGPVARVVDALVAATSEIDCSKIMLVGAFCRDAIHAALGHTSRTRATHDLDLALALASWSEYSMIAKAFPKVTDSGICFRIADLNVDLLPFGSIENPAGTVQPPARGQPMSVWAFEEIYTEAVNLTLPGGSMINIPTVAGYAAAKLGAWLDRSDYGEFKDAGDLALVLRWYTEASSVSDRLYDTPIGLEILTAEGFDAGAAAARLLGVDIVDVIGSVRQGELRARWPGDLSSLTREFKTSLGAVTSAWPEPDRRHAFIDALSRGLGATRTTN